MYRCDSHYGIIMCPQYRLRPKSKYCSLENCTTPQTILGAMWIEKRCIISACIRPTYIHGRAMQVFLKVPVPYMLSMSSFQSQSTHHQHKQTARAVMACRGELQWWWRHAQAWLLLRKIPAGLALALQPFFVDCPGETVWSAHWDSSSTFECNTTKFVLVVCC